VLSFQQGLKLKNEEELLQRIVVNPKIMGGKPIVRGTRITLELLLKLLAQGLSPGDILKDYPHLTRDDISAALLYAAKIAGEEDVYPLIV
jgi:uncharacterized protein (DUF433 family)